MMDLELAKRIIKEVRQTQFCDKITTNVMGEPLLHKDIFELLKYAEELKQNIILFTNGEKLVNETALKLFEFPPAQFYISYHSGNEKSYSHKNSLCSYEEYRNRTFGFIELKYKLKHKTPIHLSIISTYNIPHDKFKILDEEQDMLLLQKEWISFAKLIKKKYKILWQIPDSIYPGANMLLPGFYVDLYFFYHFWANNFLPSGTKVIPSQKSLCPWPFIQCNVLWNGDLTLCCADYNGDLVYDNIRDKSIIEAFNSDKIIKIRRRFIEGKDIPEKCAYCSGKLVDSHGLDYEQTKRIYKLSSWGNLKRRYFRIYRFLWKLTNLGFNYRDLMLYIRIHHWLLRRQYKDY